MDRPRRGGFTCRLGSSGSAVQRFSGSAVQRFSGSAVQRFSGSAIQRFSDSAIQRFSLIVAGLFLALACAEAPSGADASTALDDQSVPIFGTYYTDRSLGRANARADRLDSGYHAQGAVGRLTIIENDEHEFVCTGTLVSPVHFVTAGHCVLDKTDGSLYVSFPQEPDQYFQEEGGTRHTWSSWPVVSGRDVALLTLQTEVPWEIVRRYPKFNRGDVATFLGTLQPNEFIIAGFGYNGPGWEVPENYSYRTRRYGLPPAGVHLNTTGNLPIIEVPYDSAFANAHRGDAGSPLFAWNADISEYILIGIHSGGDWRTEPGQHAFASFYAFLGSSEGFENDLTPYMGPDDDGDGIPDIVDNCPPSMCDAIGDGRSCANPSQADDDGDGIGDICDICPSEPSPEDAFPAGRRVGPACGCNGQDLDYIPCEKGSTICDDENAGECLYDYDSDNNPLPGLCSHLPDEDGDGFPDKCDNCPSLGELDAVNSNIHIELERGVEPEGDVCEGVPLYPFKDVPITYEAPLVVPPPGFGALGVDVQTLQGYPWLGSEATVASIQQPVVFRHCGCVLSGLVLDPDVCESLLCPPTGAEFNESPWVRASTSPTPNGPNYPPAGFAANFESYVPSGIPTEEEDPFPEWSEQDVLYWKSYEDINRFFEPVQGDGLTGESYGLLASVVRFMGPQFASDRDEQDGLRTSLRAVTTPMASGAISIPIGLLSDASHECSSIDCFSFVAFPTKPKLAVQPYPMDPIPLIIREEVAGMLLWDGGLLDVGAFVEPALVELLTRGDWLLQPAMDRTANLVRTGLDRVAVLVPRAGGLGMYPVEVYDDHGVIRLRETPEDAASEVDLEAAVQLEDAEKAIYSAVQNKIFIIGSSPSIRTYDLVTKRFQHLPMDRQPGTRVGGFSLNTHTKRLYALEIQWVDELAQEMAQVVEYDPTTWEAAELFAVPWTDTYERTALIADTPRTLVIMGSKGGTTESWRFLIHGADPLEQVGKRIDEGVLFSEPHHSSRTAVMRLNDSLRLLEVNHQGFINAQPLDEL